MRILYIFPHPDDESYGVAHLMAKQKREGHEVFLLTLTKGGATKQRHKFNLSIDEMGEVRFKEMLEVQRVLGIDFMDVLDYPDSGLKFLDPRQLENTVKEYTRRLNPDVMVTYEANGISGFTDHLISHAVVKRAFVELTGESNPPKRLALLTVSEETAKRSPMFRLYASSPGELGCIEEVTEADLKLAHAALDCYKTFIETINNSKIKELLELKIYFQLFGESYSPPLSSLFDQLKK
ncbi:MAG: PIG-L family deacetylase [Ignavibacteriaceae bacterium]|nr:PIG-L family deacetylase [Ignavibacteriaceae bacterium]